MGTVSVENVIASGHQKEKNGDFMGLYDDLRTGGYLNTIFGTASNDVRSDGSFPDNPSLFSAEAMILGGFATWPGYPKFFDDAEVPDTNGLFHRYPGDTGNISIDELVGACTCDQDIAKSIVLYGQKHWWVFQPQGGPFQWGSWMGRYVGIIPYLKFRATQKMNPLEQILWSLGAIASSWSEVGNTSGKLLVWVQASKLDGKFWLTNQAIRIWKWQMQRKYPGGPKQLFGIYFQAGHPFIAYAPAQF